MIVVIIYFRKIFKHDTDHEISVTKGILKDFFGFSQVDKNSKITIIGKKSQMRLEVPFNAPQDPRFGGGLKQVMTEETAWSEGDIILFKKLPQHYLVEVITSQDDRHATFNSFFEKDKDRHAIIYTDDDLQCGTENTLIPSNNKQTLIAQNLLIYGVAGVGKSYYIKNTLGISEDFSERVVFHPDYSNADFIGQILPTVENDIISYKFKAGAFTKILKRAIIDKNNHYYLIIEEINRGNAPAIFGEIFQLLDRESDGTSSYKISHDLIANEIGNHDEKIYIPNNLSIVATMNSADQNVFTLDTAFQRRWKMKMIENNIDKCDYRGENILDTGITWYNFNTVINQCILEANKNTLSSEDKRLGAYFVREDELKQLDDDSNSLFAEKVIKYLWDDVFKFNKNHLFNDDFNSLDEVLKKFKKSKEDGRFDVFNDNIKNRLLENSRKINLNMASDNGIESN